MESGMDYGPSTMVIRVDECITESEARSLNKIAADLLTDLAKVNVELGKVVGIQRGVDDTKGASAGRLDMLSDNLNSCRYHLDNILAQVELICSQVG